VDAHGYSAIRSDKRQAAQSLISMPFSVMAGHDSLGASGEPKLFSKHFPNLSLISPSFSKDSFGGSAEFQGLAIESKPKDLLPNFLPLHGPEEPFAYGQNSLDR
jgi:hypothetical protein